MPERLNLVELVGEWHNQMSPEIEMEFLHAIRNLERLSPIPRWSLCAGCGVGRLFFDALSEVWLKRYEVRVEFRGALYCEINPKKQQFLCTHHPVSFLVSDMKELAKDTAANLNSQQDGQDEEVLPYVLALDCGVTCVSRTPLSGSAQSNMNCVQNGTAATGESFAMCMAAVAKHSPDMICLECVKELAQKSGDGDDQKSDAEFMVQKLTELGYWSQCVVTDAKDWGSFAARRRCYWVGLKGLQGDHSDIAAHFNSILRGTKLHKELPIETFISLYEDELEQVIRALLPSSLSHAPCPMHAPPPPGRKHSLVQEP